MHAKQQQEQISRNHVQALFLSSVQYTIQSPTTKVDIFNFIYIFQPSKLVLRVESLGKKCQDLSPVHMHNMNMKHWKKRQVVSFIIHSKISHSEFTSEVFQISPAERLPTVPNLHSFHCISPWRQAGWRMNPRPWGRTLTCFSPSWSPASLIPQSRRRTEWGSCGSATFALIRLYPCCYFEWFALQQHPAWEVRNASRAAVASWVYCVIYISVSVS